MKIKVKRLSPTAVLPAKAHASDAALDLYSDMHQVIPPRETRMIGTSIALELPTNMCALVMSRSGLAAKRGVFVLNSPGLIDPGYRGEIKIILHNSSPNAHTVNPLDRVAQLFFCSVLAIDLEESITLSSSDREGNGIGSTDCLHSSMIHDIESDLFICASCFREMSRSEWDLWQKAS